MIMLGICCGILQLLLWALGIAGFIGLLYLMYLYPMPAAAVFLILFLVVYPCLDVGPGRVSV